MNVKGGSRAYVVAFCAMKNTGLFNDVRHGIEFVPANSDDEATGLGLRIAKAMMPETNGWRNYYVQIARIDHIEGVSPFPFDLIRPQD